MKYTKTEMKKMPTIQGFKYWGYSDGLYNFSKQIGKGYINIACNEDDLSDASYLSMMDMGITRAGA